MDKLGLRILNANIAEMQDLDDANRYFFSLKQKVSCMLPAQPEEACFPQRKRGSSGYCAVMSQACSATSNTVLP